MLGVVLLLVAHGTALHYGASRVRLPMLMTGGLVALIVTMHLGLLGKVRSALRDRARDRETP